MDVYAENILDHYRHPRNKEQLPNADVTHEEKNISCGDILSVSVCINGGKITATGWQGTGCAISQSAMSMLSEECEGKSTQDMLALPKDAILELLNVPIGTRRTKCALLCLHTLKNALRKHAGKDPQSWLDTVEISAE